MTTVVEALGTRLSGFVRNVLLGVFLPGALLVLEVWVASGSPRVPRRISPTPFPYELDVGIVAILYFSYAVGFCARTASFFLSERTHYLHTRPREWKTITPLPFGTRRWGERFYCRAAFQHNVDLLRATFDADRVEHSLAAHPFYGELKRPSVAVGDESADFREIFHYCKNWLSVNVPQLSTDRMEIEFNFLFAMAAPLMAAPFVIWRVTGDVATLVISLAVVGGLTLTMYRRGNHLRHAEVFNVLRNLAFATWFVTPLPPDRGVTDSSVGGPGRSP